MELEEGQNFRKAGEFGPMAGHVNGALGLKVAHPERTVVVGCGDGCYLLSGFELMTAVQYQIPVIWIIFNDEEFKLIKLYQLEAYHETGLVEFDNPDYAAYARACGADGYRVDTLEDFEEAFGAALASGRPTVIDAKITRWAVPHYSPSPDGVIAGLVETIEARFRSRLTALDYAAHPGHGTNAREGSMQGRWKETMAGGSAEAERAEFDKLARDIMLVQLKNAKTASAHGVPHRSQPRVPRQVDPRHRPGRTDLRRPARRPEHGLRAARQDVPGDSPVLQRSTAPASPTTSRICAGVALRVQVSPGGISRPADDQLPGSHARNARQFVEFAKATAGGGLSQLLGILRLIRLFGPRETVRMLKNVLTARAAHGEQRGHRNVLEPRRGPVGPDPGGALPAPARAGHGPGPAPAGRRPELPLNRGRSPARPAVISASSCASSDTSTRSPPRSRTPPSNGRSGSPPPSR